MRVPTELLTLPELPEPQLPPAHLDPLTLDARTDEELDQLPYGVIAVDAEGTILQYNVAESRLARLDRTQVYGKSFFRQVAPCTQTPEFEGRFREFTAPGFPAPTLRFPYVFDFKFGAQQVEVELVRPRTPGRFYLVINRTRFLPPRAQVPLEVKAPLQAELAPGEARQGVVRDAASQRRAVVASPLLFSALRSTWDRVAPKAHGLFSLEWGFRWGRLATVDLEMETLEATGRSLRELPIRQALELLGRALARQGWGLLSADFAPARASGAFVLAVERSALAEAQGRTSAPRCHLMAGMLRAVFSHLAQKVLVVREVECSGQGHPRCAFVAVAQARREDLEAALRDGAGLAQVLRALEARGGAAARGGARDDAAEG